MLPLDEKRLAQLYQSANAGRWGLRAAMFREALEASLARAFAGRTPTAREAGRYLDTLHLEDLAVACACADGREDAWELLVREYRPILYRCADALDPSGGARDLADAIYGELYERSLFRYFHGRSSLATWLRSILAQRHVDRVRARRRLDPLPDDPESLPAPASAPAPEAPPDLALLEKTLAAAVTALPPRDRLRLASYYVQRLTLAEIGRLLHEHEATVSRHLARTRRTLGDDVRRRLGEAGLTALQVDELFQRAGRDAGPLDLDRLFAAPAGRKIAGPDRSEGG